MRTLSSWQPAFPEGRLDRIYLHWTAGDYATVFPSYHYCITFASGEARVVAGLSISAMRDARPEDFGPFPLVRPAIDALCVVAAALACAYRIPIDADHVMTHAEAALVDGYFGTGENERWDIARLEPRLQPLTARDASETGERLRAWIRTSAGRS
jgi:hypothetical protein